MPRRKLIDNITNNRVPYSGNDPNLTADGRKRWKKPKKMTPTDLLLLNEAVNMETAAMLRLSGYAWEAIAETLGVSFTLLSNWPKSIKFQETYAKTLEIYRREQRTYLQVLIPKALHTMEDLMANARSEHVKYEAAQAILVHAEITKDEVKQETAELHTAFLDNLRKKAEQVVHNTNIQVNVLAPTKEESHSSFIEGESKEV